jgi:hypothetical protein
VSRPRVRLRRRRRPRRRAATDPLTRLLAVAAAASTGAVVASEAARVRRRGGDALQAVEVAVAGYRRGTVAENALLNLLLSFNAGWALTRLSAYAIRRRGPFGPFRNAVIGRTHVHHFVPGIALAFGSGAVSILTRDERLDPVLAIPFGIGMAMTLDESALLLRLQDVYWSEEGILSVQVSLASATLVSALALALRVLRRGEQSVLPPAF